LHDDGAFFISPDLNKISALLYSIYSNYPDNELAEVSREGVKELMMSWMLVMTLMSGFSGGNTFAVAFETKEACEAAAKAHQHAVEELQWKSFRVVWTCDPTRELSSQ
jgi:hypothetical protein